MHPTQDTRLPDLLRLLRAEADHRDLPLPPETPDDPGAIWGALLAAQQARLEARRSQRRRWWHGRAKHEPSQD